METKVWNENEIRDLILFAKEMQNANEELRAKIIAMDAMLKNEMAKTKRLTQIIKLYETNN
jgi:erythromycin esterase-like protein